MDDFTKILPGELIWKPEHCEIYIRNDVDLHLDKNSSLDTVDSDYAFEDRNLHGKEKEANKLLQDIAAFLMRTGIITNRNGLLRRIGVIGGKSELFFKRLRKYRELLWEASWRTV